MSELSNSESGKIGRPPGTPDKPTAQRLHIKRLMRKAVHPVTKKIGITHEDIRALAASPELQSRRHAYYFDTVMGDKPGHAHAFEGGSPAKWADELAALLGKDTKTVFKHEWQRAKKEVAQSRLPRGHAIDETYLFSLSFPLDAKFDRAATQAAQHHDAEEALLKPFFDTDLQVLLIPFLGGLKAREEQILRRRFGLTIDGKTETLEEIAPTLNLSVGRTQEIEKKALRKLRMRMSHPKSPLNAKTWEIRESKAPAWKPPALAAPTPGIK